LTISTSVAYPWDDDGLVDDAVALHAVGELLAVFSLLQVVQLLWRDTEIRRQTQSGENALISRRFGTVVKVRLIL
jgi:hypothetical protein